MSRTWPTLPPGGTRTSRISWRSSKARRVRRSGQCSGSSGTNTKKPGSSRRKPDAVSPHFIPKPKKSKEEHIMAKLITRNGASDHKVVSRDEWNRARKALLTEEKKFFRTHDRLKEKRRALPWVKVEQEYLFDGPAGRETLADLFAGKRQLLVYHFMFDPAE